MSTLNKYIWLLSKKYKPTSFSQKIRHIFKSGYNNKRLYLETSFLLDGSSISERVYYILHDITETISCKNCNNGVIFKSIFKGHKKFCSKQCRDSYGRSRISKEWWASLTDEKRDAYINHYKLSYRNSYIKKYGLDVDNCSQIPEIVQKRQDTCLERYGNKIPLRVGIFKDKIKATCLEKYGAYSPLCEGTVVRNKIYETNLKRYGTKYPIEHPSIRKKAFESNYKNKIYEFGENDEVYTNGYTPRFLDFLISVGYTRDQINVEFECPSFNYYVENIQHEYRPDISLDRNIIEIKSNYTLICDLTINIFKILSVLDLGYSYLLVVYSRTESLAFIFGNIGLLSSKLSGQFKLYHFKGNYDYKSIQLFLERD